MTELKDRLDRLADAAVGDVRLDDPSTTLPGPSPARRRAWPWIGAVAAAVVLVVAVVAVLAGGGRDDADGPVVDAGPGTTVPPPAPVLSVVLPAGGMRDLPTVQVVGPDGDVGPLRSAAEVREPLEPGSEPVIARGLITRLPAPGAFEVVISLSGVQVTCPVEAGAGERLILRMDGGECGRVQTADEWAPEDTDVGRRYVGLADDEALERIAEAGYDSLLVGRDGLDILSNPEPGRIDLWVYDGVVVAANGVGRTIEEPRTTLAVVLATGADGLEGPGTVWVRLGRGNRIEQWEAPVDATPTVGLLFDDLPLGPATVDLVRDPDVLCSLDVDLAADGMVVTISGASDGTVDAPECPATVETLDEHVAAVTEGWDRYESADAYVGLTEAEAEALATEEGTELRVLARDGLRFGQDDDLRTDRVNLVLFDDEVRAAARF